MPNYRLTLVQNLPNRVPSALEVIYTYANGQILHWWVTSPGPVEDRAVVVVNCPANLINQPGVRTRVLRTHYPTPVTQVDTQISSVQPSVLNTDTSLLESEQPMSTQYSVNINMPQDTISKLTAGNYILYGFKAVQTTTGGGSPLVWFQYTQYGLSTVISWEEQYSAYTSTSSIIPNGKIKASNSYPINLENTLEVTGTTGTGEVDTLHGTKHAISILNDTSLPFTCGISQTQPDGTVTPMCAFPLYGQGLDVIAPIEQILLMFSTTPVDTGTVIEQAYSPGILINLTNENSQTVAYDINLGWSWDGGPWAQSVKAQANLVPLLIQPSSSLARKQLAARNRQAQLV